MCNTIMHDVQGAERRGNEIRQSYDLFLKILLSKLEIGSAEKNFLVTCKKFLGTFFSLIPVKTFK